MLKSHRPFCETSGKRMYPKKKQAMTAAAKQRAIRGVSLYCYKCPDCGEWHITKRERN